MWKKLYYFLLLFIYIIFNFFFQFIIIYIYVKYLSEIFLINNLCLYIFLIMLVIFKLKLYKYILINNFILINLYLIFNKMELYYFIDYYCYYMILYFFLNFIYILSFVLLIKEIHKIHKIDNSNFLNFIISVKTLYIKGLLFFNKLFFNTDIKKNKVKALTITNPDLFYKSVIYYIFKKEWKLVYFKNIIIYWIQMSYFNSIIIFSKDKELNLQADFFVILKNLIEYIRMKPLNWYIIKNIVVYLLFYFNIYNDLSNWLYLSFFENLSVFLVMSTIWCAVKIYRNYKFIFQDKKDIFKNDTKEKEAESKTNVNTEFSDISYKKNKKYPSKVIKNVCVKRNNKYYLNLQKYPFHNEVYKKYYNILYYKERQQTLNYLNAYYVGSWEVQCKQLYNMFVYNDRTYCMRLLYDEMIKPSIISPFINDNIPFTFFNFSQNKIDKNKLNDFVCLMSYIIIFKKKKQSTIDLNFKEFRNSYISFYLNKINQNSVLNMSYYNHLLEPLNILENLDYPKSLKICMDNVEETSMDDLKNVIKNTFVNINTSIKESKKTGLLINIVDIEKLNKKSFIEFLDQIGDLNKEKLSVYLKDFDFSKNVSMQPEALLNLFSDNNLFYLDYITLIYNYNKFSLCYLLFIFKILKIKSEYDNYVKFKQTEFLFSYQRIIFEYHVQVKKRFDYLLNTLNSFILNKAYKNSLNYSFSNFTNQIQFRKNRNSASYLLALHKTNIREELVELKKTTYYDAYLYFFERYKDILDNPYPQMHLEIPEIKTFDNFVYDNLKLNENTIDSNFKEFDPVELKKKELYLKFLCSKYQFDEKGELLNFEDLQFYYYNIESFENLEDDIYLFFNLRDSNYLKFIVNDDIILHDDISLNQKKDFQYNYFLIYYNYILKLIINRKICFSNYYIENILYENSEFYYKNLNVFDIDKLDNFNYFLSNFLNGFRYCVINKRKIIFDLIHNLSDKYPRFIEQLKMLDVNLMYDPKLLSNLELKDIYELEALINSIYTHFNENITKFINIRFKYVQWIDILDIRKLDEFFNFPLFDTIRGLKQLKHNYFVVLQELIEEERLFDHINNISSCCFRIITNHYKYWRYDILLTNGIFPATSLTFEDWEYIFTEVEPQNPLIYILLYNSKAKREAKGVKIPFLWSPLIKFKHIIKELSDCSERTWFYESELHDEWMKFYKLYKNKKIVNSSLTVSQVVQLKSMLSEYLHFSYEDIDIENLLAITLKELNLKYSPVDNLYVLNENIVENPSIIQNLVQDLKDENLILNKNQKINLSFSYKSYLNNLDLNLELIKFYENSSLDIKDVTLNNFFYDKWKSFKLMYFKMTDDINYFNELKKNFQNLFFMNKTYLICKNFQVDKKVLLNIINSYSLIIFKVEKCFLKNTISFEDNVAFFKKHFKDEYLESLKDPDFIFKLSYNCSMQLYIDSFIFPFFNNVLNNLKNLYNNQYLDVLKHQINVLNYRNIEEKKVLNLENMNIGCMFSLVYNIYYNCYFYSSLILYKIQYLQKILDNYIHLLQAYNLNRIEIIKHLLIELKKNKNEELLFLLNLVINFKDPLFLLNMLNLDYQLFLEYITELKDIVENPDFNKEFYKNSLIEYKLNKIIDPKFDIYPLDTCFSLYKKENLKSCISILYNYIHNYSFFDLSKYNLNEFNRYEVAIPLRIYDLENWFNIKSLKNVEPELFMFNSLEMLDYDVLITMNEDRILKFKDEFEILDFYHYKKTIPKFISLYKSKVHITKTKSLPNITFKNKDSNKMELKKNNDQIVDADADEDVTLLLQKNVEKYDIEKKKKYIEKKLDRMYQSFSIYREWGYKIECVNCYFQCKEKFEKIFLDMNDAIWDDVRFMFKKDYKKFVKFTKSLTNEDKHKLFNVIWTKGIDKLMKDRQAIHDNWGADRWDILVKAVHRKQSDMVEYYGNEFYAWKLSWNERNWYLDLNNTAMEVLDELSFEEEQFSIKEQEGYEAYTNNRVYKHQHRRLLGNKDKTNRRLINWWKHNNWWKLF